MKRKSVIGLILTLVIITASIYTAVVGIGPKKIGSGSGINLGLDLSGGVSITYETVKENPSKTEMADTKYKMQQRISGSGYTEGEVSMEGNRRINVDIPNVSDPDKILSELGKPGNLTFLDENQKIVLSGQDIKNATVEQDTSSIAADYLVKLELNDEGAKKFEKATTDNVGKRIMIVYNGQTVSAPRVTQGISGGTAVITGMADHEEADKLASYIRIGALPLELRELRSNVVGAKMGQDAIKTSVKAGIIGIILVFLFMIFFYRLPGLVSVITLSFYAALTLVIINLTGITLTLPGIAGIILSIGMAVDANVIIFSRIKEELGHDRSLLFSVKSGFKKATSAIVDGNVTTLIAAFVLYIMGTGTIQGFAVTLALGIVISMFTALVISRILLVSVVRLGLNNKSIYGISRESKVMKIVEKRRRFFIGSLVVILLGLVFIPINNGAKGTILNYDIEFAGGTSTLVSTNDKIYDSVEDLQADVQDLVVEATGDETPQLYTVQGADGKGQFVVKTKTLDNSQRQKLNEALVAKYGITKEEIQNASISATVSSEMRRDAILAVVIAAIGMLIYITLRFRDFRFGVSAVAALLHDVLVVFAVYSVLYIPINNSFIAAMLTIVGYSINDTIVVFDRIRENQPIMGRKDYKHLINTSISQTISRSINTSLTTLIMVFVLNLLGVAAIKEFALPLMVGIISGTYSSIFIASPIWYLFKKKEEAKYQKAHRSKA